MNKEIKTILLVEDEPDIQEVARLSLQSFGGFTVHVCNSGKEAIEKAAAIIPDLIMLDMMMPVMDGLTTMGKLRENPKLSNTPIIFMTAKAQTNEIKHYIESGAIGAISKPFDPTKLSDEIRMIWNSQP